MDEAFAPATDTEQATPPVTQDEGMTPESAFDATQDKSNLVEEFFRANKVEEPEAQPEPSPVEVTSEEATAEPTDVDNDVKRYQYWQSEADKARNEKEALESRLQALEQQQAQPQPENVEPEAEQFPDPPPKPAKPAGFSRQDAMDDPNSTSAQYLDAVDNWRDNMDEYNRLHTQYTQAVVQEEREKIVKERDDILRQQAEQQQIQQNMQQMGEHLTKTYGANQQEIDQFVKVMDDPKNITVDNLFQLFRMQNGTGQAPVTQTAPNESFEQRKRAQSVPSPMGVVPSQNSQQNGTDSVMDSMINDYKTKNPFG